MSQESTKVCTWCSEEKSVADFYAYTADSPRKGWHSHCKSCSSMKRKELKLKKPEVVKKYWANAKESARASRLRRSFGITPEQYDLMLNEQGGGCAVCGKTPEQNGRALAVDHDHKTGEIFGLLCTFDNHRFIGRSRDPERYRKAATYLEKGFGFFVPARKPKDRRYRRKKRKKS